MKSQVLIIAAILLISSCRHHSEEIKCGETFQGKILPISFQYGPKWNIAEYNFDKTINIDYENDIVNNRAVNNASFNIDVSVWKPESLEAMTEHLSFMAGIAQINPFGIGIDERKTLTKKINGLDWRVESMVFKTLDEADSSVYSTAKFWMLGSYQEFGSFKIWIQQNDLENEVLSNEILCFIESLKWSATKKQSR